jgi:hypothetical protein
MTNTPDLSRLLAGTDDALRKAIEVAYAKGVEDERKRLMKLLRGNEAPAANTMPTAPKTSPARKPRRKRTSDAQGYGAVIGPVRRALSAMGARPGGVSNSDIVNYCAGILGHPLTSMQVRNALKMLVKRREAKRVGTGRFAPGQAAAPNGSAHAQASLV